MNQLQSYKAIFKNDWGESEILLSRDGLEFWFELWGVKFESGTDLEFQPAEETNLELLEKFILNGLSLANYTIDLEMSVKVFSQNVESEAKLHIQHKIGLPVGRKNDLEVIILKLEYGEKFFVSSQKDGNDFYEALVEIKKQMPDGDELKICFFCENHFGREAHTLENFHCNYVPNLWVLATDRCPDFKERTTPGY